MGTYQPCFTLLLPMKIMPSVMGLAISVLPAASLCLLKQYCLEHTQLVG